MSVREELRELGVKPVEGQNFLESSRIIEALVEAGEVDGEKTLEIGAGTGNVTKVLAERSEKVYAVEKDTRLAEYLEQKFESSNVEVVNRDILEYDIPEVTRCVANLPFQVSSKVLGKLGEEQIQSSLILQKELAEKVVAEPGESGYGPLTVTVNYFFVPVKLRDVSPVNYYPEPEVETSIVKLYPNEERHGVENPEKLFEVSNALFTHKRKKLRNAFVDARHIFGIEKERAKQLRDRLPFSELRVVQLDVRKMAEVAEFIDQNI